MQERQDSGENIKDYCNTNDIPLNVYYYWQRKLREAVIEKTIATIPNEVGIVQSSIPSQSLPSGWAICEAVESQQNAVKIEIGKSRILVHPGTDLNLLAKVCQILMTLC